MIKDKTKFQILGFNSTSDYSVLVDISESRIFEIDDKYRFNTARIMIPQGTTFNNETIYPMVCDANITNLEYIPYKPTILECISKLEAAAGISQ